MANTSPPGQQAGAASQLPPPGWYPNPQGPGMRYWGGSQWTEHVQSAPGQAPQDAQFRDAFVINGRMQVASGIAIACAVLLLAIFIGALASSGTHETIFDMGRKTTGSGFTTKVYRPGLGYLIGPVVILAPLLSLIMRKPRVFYKNAYVAFMAISTLSWLVGLVTAIGGTEALSSDGYTIETGMYVALVLLSVGVLANLAIWPFATRTVRVDQAGNVSEPPAGG